MGQGRSAIILLPAVPPYLLACPATMPLDYFSLISIPTPQLSPLFSPFNSSPKPSWTQVLKE